MSKPEDNRKRLQSARYERDESDESEASSDLDWEGLREEPSAKRRDTTVFEPSLGEMRIIADRASGANTNYSAMSKSFNNFVTVGNSSNNSSAQSTPERPALAPPNSPEVDKESVSSFDSPDSVVTRRVDPKRKLAPSRLFNEEAKNKGRDS